jgi:hypothetical protein
MVRAENNNVTRRVSMATRKELIEVVNSRYREGSLKQRSAILDEFVAITGYHRKHAIRLLSKPAAEPQKRSPRAVYGADVRQALGVLWEVSDRVCSKRLKAMIPALLPALIRHGKIESDAALQKQLTTVSAATIDRLLEPIRLAAAKGRRRAAGQSSAIRRAVPIRTFGDWDDPVPGYVEVDFVAHCGPHLSGSFVQTLVLTDIATGWTECIPVLTRDGTLVIDAIAMARELFPFRCAALTSTTTAFMNERVVTWCREQGLEVTRARAYRKNDQAWVEQKNGAIVRRLVGDGRFEGLECVQTLITLYRAARVHTNLVQPSFKLRTKTRIGARVVKKYHPPVPPAHRVLAHEAVSEEAKVALQRLLSSADPVVLFAEIRAAQDELGRRVDRRGVDGGAEAHNAPQTQDSPNIEVRKTSGEQRTIHRRPYIRRKPLPRRPKMLDAYETQVRDWLKVEPGLTAVDMLRRLQDMAPAGTFTSKHLRTVQRALETWRAEAIRQWIDQCRVEPDDLESPRLKVGLRMATRLLAAR